MEKTRWVRLGLFREDPDNVSEATAEEIERLAGKLRRVPLGLTAMRIAYVTDAPGGGCMVIRRKLPVKKGEMERRGRNRTAMTPRLRGILPLNDLRFSHIGILSNDRD